MKFGAILNTGLVGDRPADLREFAQALDGAGFDYMSMAAHLLATYPDRYPDRPNITYVGPHREPFVLYSHLAAVTRRITFVSSIIALPIYPTAVVAKQAAELSMLSEGRFILGVGITWNPTEYEAAGQDFKTRGAREAEQIELLRLFWTQPVVNFEGRFHKVDGMNINPRPPVVPPIWMGGSDERALRRVAKLADGFIPLAGPPDAIKVRQYLEEEGRDPSKFDMSFRLSAGDGGPDAWIAAAKDLQAVGATHIAIDPPQGMGKAEAIARMMEARTVLAAAF
jgi:probable F420-dependent oxidoreductase